MLHLNFEYGFVRLTYADYRSRLSTSPNLPKFEHVKDKSKSESGYWEQCQVYLNNIAKIGWTITNVTSTPYGGGPIEFVWIVHKTPT